MIREKRKHKRVERPFAVNITSAQLDGQHFRFDRNPINPKLYNESGVDFTHAGVRLMCSKYLTEGTKVTLKMLIPDDVSIHIVKASGTIRWYREVVGEHKRYYYMGVEFDQVEGTGSEVLKGLWEKYS